MKFFMLISVSQLQKNGTYERACILIARFTYYIMDRHFKDYMCQKYTCNTSNNKENVTALCGNEA